MALLFSASDVRRKHPHQAGYFVPVDDRLLDTEQPVGGLQDGVHKNEVQDNGAQQEDAGGNETKSRKEEPS
jgi:hypothetical protein